MKIAFLVGQFPALSATFILNQVTGLLDLDHDVQVFAFKDPKEGKVHPDFYRYRLSSRVHYFSIPENRLVRVLKAIGLLIRCLPDHGSRIWSAFNVRRFGKEALNLTLFYCLLPFLSSDYDILHCHFGTMGLFGTYLKDLGLEAKLLTTFYGFDLSSQVKESGERVYERLFARADLFLPICAYFKDKLAALGCPQEKIRIQHVGIAPGKYPFKPRHYQPGSPIYILGVGRLCEKKGFAIGLQAICILKEKNPHIRYLIVGSGPQKELLQDQARSLRIEANVQFLGPVDETELLALYHQAHLFLLPSLTASDGDQEGTPTVLLEAQAVGLPIVSTFHSGIPEIVEDGETALLVPENDVAALVERMDYLIAHPELWPEMGRKGRQRVLTHFDIKKLTARLLEYYRELL